MITILCRAANARVGGMAPFRAQGLVARSHRQFAWLRRLNPAIRGWCDYFCHGVSKQTFSYLDHYAFWRIVGLAEEAAPRTEHARPGPPLPPGWEISADEIDMFRPNVLPALAVTRQVIAVDLHGHGRTPLGNRKINLVWTW